MWAPFIEIWETAKRLAQACGEIRGGIYETLDGTSDDFEAWCEYCDIVIDDELWNFCPKCGRKIRETEALYGR